jgi:hypothetical protein
LVPPPHAIWPLGYKYAGCANGDDLVDPTRERRIAKLQASTKMIQAPAQPTTKRCPVCGVSMVRTRTKPELDHFECLNCGAVLNYSVAKKAHPKPANGEKKQREP